ncbi:uncharacterized protein LOC114362753 [Ostrinia furnacalis]|uniref:uncharacterized protein LOC114362753 n=1 Tax=Ostrinia furnacalis TaxID=93504 RepID=UPI00103FF6E4|nr:uncharacterized protein LOC114362753 [Ostrinia furnacalis]
MADLKARGKRPAPERRGAVRQEEREIMIARRKEDMTRAQQLRINKARALSNLFPKKQKAASAASQDLFDDFQVDNEELTLIEDSLMIDDASSDNKKKQQLSVSSDDASSNNKEKQLLSVSSDFISLEEEEKENISNGGQTPKKT